MNNLDRTSKVLLLLLVIGVWGLLVRPFFFPVAAHAQVLATPQKTKQTAISVTGEFLYLYQDGKLYVYGFEGAVNRRRELAAKGFARPLEPDENKPTLLSTYDLAVRSHTR